MTQRLQMISVTDPNIHNIALDGNFDDCQVRAASTPAAATHRTATRTAGLPLDPHPSPPAPATHPALPCHLVT